MGCNEGEVSGCLQLLLCSPKLIVLETQLYLIEFKLVDQLRKIRIRLFNPLPIQKFFGLLPQLDKGVILFKLIPHSPTLLEIFNDKQP